MSTEAPGGPGAEEVLRFWFKELTPAQWFRRSTGLDRTIRDRFEALSERALAGALAPWGERTELALALVLVLDQFPRQIWRDQARAFAGDPLALALSEAAVAAGWIAAEPELDRRRFWLMPLMHSEHLEVQERACALFAEHVEAESTAFAERHRAVIRRFGRFPHRNRALGRVSTPEEVAFLLEPGSRF
ncbi:DUF924 domain-containing protein [Cyanobium sp. Morenito 9A2]|nr:DUF924 domain-containing protein [Cyanobium sp. Morenito 9A2]